MANTAGALTCLVAAGLYLAACATAGGGPAGRPNHREYFDETTGRYYFYDPATRRYFWEDGAPR